MYPTTVKHVSECFIKPKHALEESMQPIHLTPWDLNMLCTHYIQKGLLFAKHQTPNFNTTELLVNLKHSLSVALVHFYPLAGRLKTSQTEDPASCMIYVDCNNSPGARFIHAAVDITISDVLSPTYVPWVVQSFFDHHKALNHDGHTLPLLSVQVTELVDGIFIGCSMNHGIADGTSFWNFFNTWSEIFQEKGSHIPMSLLPIVNPWFPDGEGPITNLPVTLHEQFTSQYEASQFKEMIFHFSAESVARLKAKANLQENTTKISSLQALLALVWRCITRARCLCPDQVTNCWMPGNVRLRLDPPLSQNHFGNLFQPIRATTSARQLLKHNLGWAAWKLHQAVVNHTNKEARKWVDSWIQSPSIPKLERWFNPCDVRMGSSPRFNAYGPEFGLGKALALRSGYANKFFVTAFPGREGGGSVDLEICLPPKAMNSLESDPEFMDAILKHA